MLSGDAHSAQGYRADDSPKANPERKELRFVVQKHAAHRLHYDFRLELDGVLRSWAIPKGPSLDPLKKRLAVMVEDHPMEYFKFEGTIPEGSYGAGTVMVWDEGKYEPYSDNSDPQASVREALQKGELKFILHGSKLKGAFVLVRLAPRKSSDNWLLIKVRDEFATPEDPLKDDLSVLSGRSLDQIASVGSAQIEFDLDLDGARISRQPVNLAPMLATLIDEPFTDQDWITEVKWDGYRIVSFVKDGSVQLRSRNGRDYTSIFTPVARELAVLNTDCILDGEMVVVDEQGISDFESLQNYQKTRSGNLRYFVFDLPFVMGYDLRDQPLIRRKNNLREMLPALHHVRYSDHVIDQAEELFQEAKKRHLEGLILKDSQSKYLDGKRAKSWLKIKTRLRQEAVICGYSEPKKGRQKLGALILGLYKDGELTFIGNAGSGFSDRQLEEIYWKLHQIEQRNAPCKGLPRGGEAITWVEPRLLCEIEFSGWAKDGLMRQPVFKGFREDKNPSLAIIEEPQHLPRAKKYTAMRHSRVAFTNLHTVFWPQQGYTKGELVAYYEQVSQLILPYLENRPESLNRHPKGIEEPGFFQKDIDKPPEWVETATIHSESGDKEIRWLVCNTTDTLLYMINLGCIEINPWLSRLQHLDRPDFCVLDLDAKTSPFDAVVRVANEAKKLLDELKVPSYPKTSGKTGMHICIPLAAKYSYEQSRQFAELISRMINSRLPGLTSLERDPSKRRNKIYLDFLQNRRGQTIAAPYCVRPIPQATVSTPLSWEEVDKTLLPSRFTMKTALERFNSVGDLWRPVIGEGIDMISVLDRLQS